MGSSHSSLSLTRTPKNTHTQKLQLTTGLGVAGEGLAVDDGPANDEADEEGTGQRQKDVRREFSIRNPTAREEDETTYFDLRLIHDGIPPAVGHPCHLGEEETSLQMKEGNLFPETFENRTPPLLGFVEDERSRSLTTMEDQSLQTTDGCNNVVGIGGVDPMAKDNSLATVQGNPTLGFGASKGVNGGRSGIYSPAAFNLDEFLGLANKVLDGDDSARAALQDLKKRWENRFGRNYLQRTWVAPATAGFLKPRRCLMPAKEGESDGKKTGENAGLGASKQNATGSSSSLEQWQIPATLQQLTATGSMLPAATDISPEGGMTDQVDDAGADVGDDAGADVEADADADLINDAGADTGADAAANVMHDISNNVEKIQQFPTQVRSFPTGLFVGNIPLNTNMNVGVDEKIAEIFNNSCGRTLSYIPPTIQNGEVVVRPTMEAIRNGSTKWKTTAVSYFLRKRPYFYHVKDFSFSVWPELREVKATTNGFFFFQFKTVAYMEEAIEGGPWLFQGQPIVLQKWEPGMVMRKLQHTQVPVWIKLRHLSVELWTNEGLSMVASGIGKPLYPDAITRACTRLDFARVCVMLDVRSTLPKHIIIMTLDEERGEILCKIDVEYEWIPPKCTSCMTLGHSAKDCALNKPSKPIKPLVAIYVPKTGVTRPPPLPNQEIVPPTRAVDKQRDEHEPPRGGGIRPSREEKGKEIVIYNTFDALHLLEVTGS
ncbi:UNVERIFIED_CONTAM: hypothetical protein Sindi_1280300 [Sesamum indicum]